jgi:hypothetical protein
VVVDASANSSRAVSVSVEATSRGAEGKGVALLIGRPGVTDTELVAAALARARALGFDARDYRNEYSRWTSTSLFYGRVEVPPPWVTTEIAAVWRRDGASCPPMPAERSEATEQAADAAYACTQGLLAKLREQDLARHRPVVIFEVEIGEGPGEEQEVQIQAPSRWYAKAYAGRPNDSCARYLGAGAERPYLIGLRDAVPPGSKQCAIATAVHLLERLLRGDPGSVTTRGGVGLRVAAPACPQDVSVDIAARESVKKPERICPSE